MNAPFLGKWVLTNTLDATNAVTVNGSGQMVMTPFKSSPTDDQRLNVYGDLDSNVAFQAANEKHLVFSSGGTPPRGGGLWLATCSTLASALTFQLAGDAIAGDDVEGYTPYFFADGTMLYAEFAYDFNDPSREAGGRFDRRVISPGLADLLTSGGHGLDLRWVNFSGDDVTGIKLTSCDLTNADFSGATLIKATLSGSILRGVRLDDKTEFTDAQLDGVDLTGTTVENVNFSRVNLRSAVLNQATFHHTIFVGADLSDASALGGGEGVSFGGCDLSYSKMENAKLKGARFAAGNGLPAAVLANCFMPNADLTSANLVSVDLPRAQWYGAAARADGADLTDANLSQANLATMDLSQVKMNGAVLSSANLVNTDLRGASLGQSSDNRFVSMASASLQGADLTGARLPGADLSGAAVALSISGPAKTFVGVPLFDITDTSLTSDLDGRQVSTKLKNAFINAGYPVIDTATITVVGAGRQWSIDNYDTSGSSLQQTYGTFSLLLRTGQTSAIRVYGSPPLLVTAYNADNEQTQQAPNFGETKGLMEAIDDDTTCPNGMRWSQRNHGIEVETLMTAGEPPHPPACVPSEDNWCFLR
ncbi:pentapeptide repeat-containing protein [Nocardia sp. NPDC051929]|uniref:pentapeptide repeat-containing protein n=1 Tax=unclassified Nocardia TaxID=2637762 RepID=UPI003414436B